MMKSAIVNARVITGEEILCGKTLVMENGLIKELTDSIPNDGTDIYDAYGLYVSAGFIDLHVHGGGGFDFSDGTKEAFEGAAALHLRHGTTTLMPTLVAGPESEMLDCFSALRDIRKNGSETPLPNLSGIHLEGPFLAKNQAVAIDSKFLRLPDKGSVDRLLEYKDVLGRITIAPELPEADAAIKRLSCEGILVSLGHSDAVYAQALNASENGAKLVTHLYSAMSSIIRVGGHRVLGLLESAYLLDSLFVEIISDGVHLPPELLKLIVKTKSNAKICLTTDAMRGAGMQSGSRLLLGSLSHGREVIIADGVAYLPDRSAFAGSVCTADRCVRVMYQKAGVPLGRAVAMMTENPAELVGLKGKKGTISPGADADLVMFDDDIKIYKIFLKGKSLLSCPN